jgi:hypothetical protein
LSLLHVFFALFCLQFLAENLHFMSFLIVFLLSHISLHLLFIKQFTTVFKCKW